jgi:hypothetical protein
MNWIRYLDRFRILDTRITQPQYFIEDITAVHVLSQMFRSSQQMDLSQNHDPPSGPSPPGTSCPHVSDIDR